MAPQSQRLVAGQTALLKAHCKNAGHDTAMKSLFAAWYNFARKHDGVEGAVASNGLRANGPRMDDQRTDREISDLKLRRICIAWTVGWSIVCLLLGSLWLRSHWYKEGWTRQSGSERYEVISVLGVLRWGKTLPFFGADHPSWQSESRPALLSDSMLVFFPERRVTGPFNSFCVPYWFPFLIAAITGMMPWLLNWFRMRTLLISAILIAILLRLWWISL
jgi:hypothetical protein